MLCLEFESSVLGNSVLLPWSWNVIILNSATMLQSNAKAILDKQPNASDPLVSNPIKKQKIIITSPSFLTLFLHLAPRPCLTIFLISPFTLFILSGIAS